MRKIALLIMAMLAVCLLLMFQAASARAGLHYNVTPWRSVILSWDVKNVDLYIEKHPIYSTKKLKAYSVRPQNIALFWDTRYSYDPETDSGVLKTDNGAGWNPFQKLINGDDSSIITTSAPGEKRIVPVFDFSKSYWVSSINIIARCCPDDLCGSTRVELFAGTQRSKLRLIKSTDIKLNKSEFSGSAIQFAPTIARFLKVRIVSNCSRVEIGEMQIFGVNDFKRERKVEITDLNIGGKYYAAVSSNGKLYTTRFEIPKLLERNDLSERFGVNVHLERHYPDFNDIEREVQLIAKAGIRHISWYPTSGYRRVLGCLKKYGVGATMIAYRPGTIQSFIGGEPENHKVPPPGVVRDIVDARKQAKAENPMYLVGGPSCSGENVEYSARIISSLKPGDIDFYDFHPYVKTTTDTIPGLARNLPENIATIYKKNRQMLQAGGFSDKRFTAGEFGYSSYDGSSWTYAATEDQQAAFLVRIYLAQIKEGCLDCYWYDFRNDGTDKSNPEHNFGIVNDDLTPKPAYYAYKFMTSQLGCMKYTGSVKGVSSPTFGYSFADANGASRYVYVFADAMGRSVIQLDRPGSKLRLYDMFGHPLKITGSTISFQGNPVYLVSPVPVRIKAAKSLPIEEKEGMNITIPRSGIIAIGSQDAKISLQLKNAYKKKTSAVLTLTSDAFVRPVTSTLVCNAGENLSTTIIAPLKDIRTGVYFVKIHAALGKAESVDSQCYLYGIKKLEGTSSVYPVDINGDGKNEIVLESESLHVLITPYAGSRVFRIIDKSTLADQLFVPPGAKFGAVDTTNMPSAGEWFSLSGITGLAGFVYDKEFTYRVLSDNNEIGVEMVGTVEKYQITHTVKIADSVPNAVVETYVVKNVSDERKTFDFRTHPQLVPGGRITFGNVDINIASKGKTIGNTFLAYRGDMGEIVPDKGWWNAVNLENRYSVRCDFEQDKVQSIYQWHDGEFFNMELLYHTFELQPGQSKTLVYTYTLTSAS